MWSFNQKKQEKPGNVLVIKIDGMHCTSCALTIDEELEELTGVYEARTSYAKGEVVVRFDEKKVEQNQIEAAIEKLGYTVSDTT